MQKEKHRRDIVEPPVHREHEPKAMGERMYRCERTHSESVPRDVYSECTKRIPAHCSSESYS